MGSSAAPSSSRAPRSRRSSRTPKQAPASVAAPRIVQAALAPDCSAADLAEMAKADPAFALRVLSLVNSAAFRLQRPVQDVGQAAMLLGVRGLRNVALSLVVSDMVPAGELGSQLLAGALRRAIGARELARGAREPEAEGYFTVGLFLDAGLLVRVGMDAEGVERLLRLPARIRLVSERADGLPAHPDLGAELAEQHGLPAATVAAIRHHHDEHPPKERAAQLAWAAERLASVFEGGSLAGLREAALAAALEVGVPRGEAQAILDRLPAEVADAAAGFDRDVGPQLSFDELLVDANEQLVVLNEQYEETVRTLERVIAEKESLALQLQQANEQLSTLAMTDALTALPNKRAFTEALERDLARAARDGTSVSLVVLDVDHFKKFNDTWGHSTGDEVLRQVGQLLPGCLRAGDLAARVGGEEFAVVLPRTRLLDAVRVAERIRKSLEAMPVKGPEGALQVTASLGVAGVTGDRAAEGLQTLYDRADAALYDAKGAGRNRVSTRS